MTSCSCLDIVFRCHLHWSTRLSYQQASQTNADNTNSSSISSHPKRLTNSIDSCSSRVEDLYVRRRHAIGYSPQHQQLGSSARHQARLAAATCSSRQWHRVIITARLQRQEGVMWWTSSLDQWRTFGRPTVVNERVSLFRHRFTRWNSVRICL